MQKNNTISGIDIFHGDPISLEFNKQGIISKTNNKEINPELPYIAPGLVDIQINGYAGHDFNTLPLHPDIPAQVTKALWAEGVTSYLPTVITNSDSAIEEIIRRIYDCRWYDEKSAGCIAGIHLEGPFISPETGPRGAHDPQWVKEPDWNLFEKWQMGTAGMIKIVTLSPEWDKANEFISKAVDNGVIVAIGHSNATHQQIIDAVDAGASLSTHLGNGAHGSLPRHPNYIWSQLSDDRLTASFIADGFHLPKEVLKVMFRAKGEKAILTSDAVYLAGMRAGEYNTHVGGQVVLTPEGKLHLKENSGILAGSAQTLRFGIANIARSGLKSLADAWMMGSIKPADLLGIPQRKGLTAGAPADFVTFYWKNYDIQIESVYKNGQMVFHADH